MATVLVTGGTGTLGRQIVPRLIARHHHTCVLSHSAQATVPPGAEVIVGDLASAEGLRDAVASVDVIVHAATSVTHVREVDENGTRVLLDAARASVQPPHVVYISIVGVDRTDFPYYTAKHTAESLIQQSGLPWSILRATQFHDYAVYIIQSLGGDTESEVTVPAGVRLQPIDSAEVADRLVAIAELGPSTRIAEMGGPEVLSLEAMTEAYVRARGRAATVRAVHMPDPMFDMFRTGVILTPDHAVGVTTWEAFLQREYAR